MGAAGRIESLRQLHGRGHDLPRPAARLLLEVAAAAARQEHPSPELQAALDELGGGVREVVRQGGLEGSGTDGR
jgi:hypothetical protein